MYGQKDGLIRTISLEAGNLDFLQNEKRVDDDFKFLSADIAGNNSTDFVVLNSINFYFAILIIVRIFRASIL